MRNRFRIVAALVSLAGAPAYAQTAPAAEEPAEAAPAASEVTPYPAAFFAPYRPFNAWDMISRIPGFSVDTGDNVRGLSGTAGNVLIDGERPPGKTGLNDILDRLRANQIERIDLIRGGAPGIDMQGKAQVINIIRLERVGGYSGAVEAGARYVPGVDRLDGTLDLLGVWELANGIKLDGELSYNRAEGEAENPGESRLRLSPSGALISSVASTSEEFEEDLSATLGAEFRLFGGDAMLRGSTDWSREEEVEREFFNAGPDRLTAETGEERGREVEASYAYSLSNGGRVQAVFSQNWSEEWSDSISLSGRPPTAGREEEKRGELGVTVSYPLGSATRVQTVLAKSWGEESSTSSSIRSGGTLSNEIDNEEVGETAIRTSLFFDPQESLSIEAGAEGAYNFLEGSSQISLNGTTLDVPGSEAEVDERRGEVFAVAIWRARPTLTLEGALRYEFSTLSSSGLVKRLKFLKPMAQARWRVGDDSEIVARVERTVGQLNFGDFLSSASISEFDEIITAGAVELTPTQDWVSSLQFDHRFWETGAFRVELEYHSLSDVIDTRPIVTPDGVFEGRGNIGDGRQAYFNTELDAPLDNLGIPGGRLGIDLGVLIDSEMTDPFTMEARAFAWDRDYNFDIDFEQEIRPWNATWGFSVYANAKRYSYRRDNVEVFRETPGFSAFVAYRPDPRSTWRLAVDNIVARRFETRRSAFEGQRDITPVSFLEIRKSEWAPVLRLTYRRETT